jgi:hypothetical protein
MRCRFFPVSCLTKVGAVSRAVPRIVISFARARTYKKQSCFRACGVYFPYVSTVHYVAPKQKKNNHQSNQLITYITNTVSTIRLASGRPVVCRDEKQHQTYDSM